MVPWSVSSSSSPLLGCLGSDFVGTLFWRSGLFVVGDLEEGINLRLRGSPSQGDGEKRSGGWAVRVVMVVLGAGVYYVS